MYKLIKYLFVCALFLSSFSASAFDCATGGTGLRCVWGFDPNEPDKLNLIDRTALRAFCDKNQIHCGTSFANEYNALTGRFLGAELFLLTGIGWGGPDLILDNKQQAEQFAADFKGISPISTTRFFVKDDSYPTRRLIAIGYRDGDDIKLLILPNEWDVVGDDHAYVPPDE